jgi:hypothetical protein
LVWDLCFDIRNINEGINMMVKTLQRYKVKTYCEHCKKEFENVWICKMDSIIGIKYALLCTGCQKLIGINSPIDFKKIPINQSNIF